MEASDILSSQDSLPLSQESFKYLWQEWSESNNLMNILDPAELKSYLTNDSKLCKVEDSESYQMEGSTEDVVPASTSSTDLGYTNLTIPDHGGLSTIGEEYDVDEYYPERIVQSQQVNSSNIPPTTDWPGDYDFTISFQPQEKATKSTSWTYSEIKEKLFVNMAVACPVNIHVTTKPPPGSAIRAMSIFSRSEHITDVVRRCLNHSNPTDSLNDGHPAPNHLIRCDNSSSQYVEDSKTGRQSVITSYEPPQAGMEYTTYMYRFMCLGSCVGGLNRRPLKLIFTLEKDGNCLGRRVMDLRICACPGRDKRTEEKQFEKHLKRSSSYSKNLDVISGPPVKKQKSDSGDEESNFTLVIRNRSDYEFLRKLRDALELSRLLTPEQSAALRRSQRGKPASFVNTRLPTPLQSSSNNSSFPAGPVESQRYSWIEDFEELSDSY